MTYITGYQIFFLLKRTKQLYATSKIKMTINYTKQKLEMTTITQNKIGKVVPGRGGGGANGELQLAKYYS